MCLWHRVLWLVDLLVSKHVSHLLLPYFIWTAARLVLQVSHTFRFVHYEYMLNILLHVTFESLCVCLCLYASRVCTGLFSEREQQWITRTVEDPIPRCSSVVPQPPDRVQWQVVTLDKMKRHLQSSLLTYFQVKQDAKQEKLGWTSFNN